MSAGQPYPPALSKHGIVAALSASEPVTPDQLVRSLRDAGWPLDGRPVTASSEAWVWL